MDTTTDNLISVRLSPDDVAIGDYITITHMTYELIPPPCGDSWNKTIEPSRVTILHHDAGRPLKVIEVCIPFILTRDANGQHEPVDLRRCRIARLSQKYGKRLFKKQKPAVT